MSKLLSKWQESMHR